ncbi:MAG TPA: hemerythrin domain-containing protein [Caulobacteraceae bacterium]|nr:hemerythrin domain-containing protein [Caulobacteraceae bacterium]
MATRSKTRAHQSANRKLDSSPGGKDALSLLRADHREVKQMFEAYEDLADNRDKGECAHRICQALKIHTMIEEEIFYPAARRATRDDQLLDESEVEHAGAKDLIAQIEAMRPGEKLYDAKVAVLGEQVNHHIREEEGELFPEVRDAKMDLVELGERMQRRKAELMSQLPSGGTGSEEDAGAQSSPRA